MDGAVDPVQGARVPLLNLHSVAFAEHIGRAHRYFWRRKNRHQGLVGRARNAPREFRGDV